ncbi:conjugal transfer transcriptional regulator TraJ [Legionella sp. km535]|uniref:conjugal transfer transcriptional regulator TraJ n=1 Tax=Legionella sp. km535 TaxID=2498107 RepID=UPI000F8F32ED|nr:conjugal transfer transcriptional regulator TraJ [Legionella sp. km535]RUR17663.1 conjugal transfer transcriptional regulator TraJ [Legionella sp. km535]
MDEKLKTPTRKNGRHLRVPVLPSEEIQIKSNAATAGLSIAEYLRRISLGYQIQSNVDKDQILQLAKINGDLGRLGGLLKLWLTQDKRVAHFDLQTIKTLLARIQTTQDAMFEVVKKL